MRRWLETMGLLLTVSALGASLTVAYADEGGLFSWSPFSGSLMGKGNSPSLLSRLGSGTKRVWTGTRDLVTYPFREKPQPEEPIWGRSRVLKRGNNAEESKPGLLSSLFSSAPERKKPETVVDWMKQPKPKF